MLEKEVEREKMKSRSIQSNLQARAKISSRGPRAEGDQTMRRGHGSRRVRSPEREGVKLTD